MAADTPIFQDPADARVEDLKYKHTILLCLNDIRRHAAWETKTVSESMRNLRNNYRRVGEFETLVAPWAKDADDFKRVTKIYKDRLWEWRSLLGKPKFDADDFNNNLLKWKMCIVQQLGRVGILPKIYEPILWGLEYNKEGKLVETEWSKKGL